MVEEGTSKKDKHNHLLQKILHQATIPNSWLLPKSQVIPINELDRFPEILTKHQMETNGSPLSPTKRPFDNNEQQLEMKRMRYMDNSQVDGNDNKRIDVNGNNQVDRNDSKRIGKLDKDAGQRNKSLLTVNHTKPPITLTIRNRNGCADNIPIDKTIPNYRLMLQAYIDGAFADLNKGMSQTIYEIVSFICGHGDAQVLFTTISSAIGDNAQKLCDELESLAPKNINFLAEMESQWNRYQMIMANINSICSEINFLYIYKETNSRSLLDFGLHVYTNLLTQNIKIRKRMTSNIIYLMERERSMKSTNNECIQSAMKLLYQTTPAYIPHFENELITATTQYYNHRSLTALSSMTIPNYIVFATKLLLIEPILKHEYSKYLFTTDMTPADIVVTELFLKHIDYIVHKGFKQLIELDHDIPLKTLYRFISPYDEVAVMHTAFGDYIKVECTKLCENYRIADPESYGRSPDEKGRSVVCVVSLLEFKSRMNSIIKSCFGDDIGFQHTLKDSFEVATYLHQASSAHHIACYVDDQLKSPWPFSPSASKSLDDVIGLLRSLQAEEEFKPLFNMYLAVQLLQCQQPNTIAKCANFTERLKLDCGNEFVKDMHVMIKDMKRSGKQARRFKDENRVSVIPPLDRIDMNFRVLTSDSWSLRFWSQHVKLPNVLLQHQEIYQKFYHEKHPHRRLNWMPALGTCDIQAAYPSCTFQIITTEIQALILLLFNNTNIQHLSVKQICKETGIDETRVKESLSVLSSQETPFLLNCQLSEPSEDGDYDIFSYNTAFNSTQPTIEVQDISAELLSTSVKVMKNQQLFTQREKIQALLMKLLKQHRCLSMADLQQLANVGNRLTPRHITKELEHLVERGFVEQNLETEDYIYRE